MSGVRTVDDEEDREGGWKSVPILGLIDRGMKEGFGKVAETPEAAEVGGGRWLLNNLAKGQDLLDRMGFPRVAEGERHITLSPRMPAPKLLLVFAGTFASIRMIPMLVRRTDCQFAYMRDTSMLWHISEIPGLGANFEENLEGFRKISRDLKAPEIYCLGVSSGGYSALKYGLHLGAKSVLGISATTTNWPEDLPESHRPVLNRFPGMVELVRTRPGVGEDMVAAYKAAAVRPTVTLAYGGDNRRDVWHAERMRDIPGVRLWPVEGWHKHVVWMELARTKVLHRLIDECLA